MEAVTTDADSKLTPVDIAEVKRAERAQQEGEDLMEARDRQIAEAAVKMAANASGFSGLEYAGRAPVRTRHVVRATREGYKSDYLVFYKVRMRYGRYMKGDQNEADVLEVKRIFRITARKAGRWSLLIGGKEGRGTKCVRDFTRGGVGFHAQGLTARLPRNLCFTRVRMIEKRLKELEEKYGKAQAA